MIRIRYGYLIKNGVSMHPSLYFSILLTKKKKEKNLHYGFCVYKEMVLPNMISPFKCFFFFFLFPTMFPPQSFQSETNHCSRRVDSYQGKSLVQKVFSKCWRLDLNQEAPSQTQDNHFETECPTQDSLFKCFIKLHHSFMNVNKEL